MRKVRKKRKRRKIALTASICGIVMISCGFAGYKYYYPDINIKKSPLVIEYEKGKEISDYKKLVANNSNAETNKVNWGTDIKVGEYVVNSELRGSKETYTVEVVDTTAPVISAQGIDDGWVFENGTVNEDIIQDKIEVDDASDYSIKVVLPEYFTNTKAGDYSAGIVAADKYGNYSEVEIPFTIQEKRTTNVDNAIEIEDVGIYAYLNTGLGQEEVDVKGYDGTILTQLNMPGSGEPILVAGHNNREFKDLHNVEVGDDITLYYEGYEYKYEVIYSDICSTTGPDLTDKDTGENELEYSGRDVLQMYTCYKIYADNERWVVKAIRQ